MDVRGQWIKIIVILVILLSGGQAWAGAGGPYKIATVAWAGWSPLHVAEEKGFWKELDIAIEIRNYDDPIVILEAIKAGRIDLAMDMVGSLIGVYMECTPIVALAETNWSHGGDRVIVRKGYSLKEHLGETVGVFLKQPSCLYFLGAYLKTQGLKIADFRIVEINPDDLSDQFIAGRLPVIVNYDPWALKAQEFGNGVTLATSADFEGCIPECLWGYRDHLQSIPGEDIKKIIRGWVKAVAWLKRPENRNEFEKILRTRTFRNQNPDSVDIEKLLAGVIIHTPEQMLERNRDRGGLAGYLKSLRLFLKENGMLKKDYLVGDIFDNRYVMEVLNAELNGDGSVD